jgi:hypothetical protein
MLIYEYSEGGVFWTGPDFGCVHHQSAAAECKFGAVERLRQVVESAPEATP